MGLHPIEKLTNGVRLRFWWFPPKGRSLDERAIDLATNPLLIPPSAMYRQPKIAHSDTLRPIIDGQMITITSDDDPSAVPDWDILSLQWDLIRMCALSGAGEYVPDDEDDDDDDMEQTSVPSPFTLEPAIELESWPGGKRSILGTKQEMVQPLRYGLASRSPSPVKVLRSRPVTPAKAPRSHPASPEKGSPSLVDRTRAKGTKFTENMPPGPSRSS